MAIEKYLVLNKYLLSLFGANDFRDLQEKLKDAPVGVDGDGRTHFVNCLRSAFDKIKISEDDLLRYDGNILSYVRKINYRRSISLKYFQYLAVLFAEIVLDNLKNREVAFLEELNSFYEEYRRTEGIEIVDRFTKNDLRKLAFWMATGSGKTLIMHINYHQFFNYNPFSPENIILITPNEGLSKQHFAELQDSGIPARLYTGSLNGGMKTEGEVLVIEITKFVEEKKGRGVTLPVAAFEGRNLVFVDEGHKGKKSEEQKWAKLRNKLAEDGFVFEYSATFGQILSASNPEVLREYAKSIVFDYSYKYFYLDGYGKDFYVVNAENPRVGEQRFQEVMFVANLLSFYEQLLVYERNKQLAREYNLEKPLWIFVGSTVTGKKEESDVLQIVELLKRAIEDENWVREWADRILAGESGLRQEGKDLFADRFNYLRKDGFNLQRLYRMVFGGRGGFGVYEIKRAEGELGLKIGENDYFGVINIGDVSGFKKQLEKKGVSVRPDVISASLFDEIKKEPFRLNILIGSKKFIEGWDTWRVSSMGLLNIGTGQGPQIIQLFGRGVRLKGKEMSLKRSNDKNGVECLETLNIYGIKADYLSRFLEAIKKEEVEYETIEIPVKHQHEAKWDSLHILHKDARRRFEEVFLKLALDSHTRVELNLLPKVTVYRSEPGREDVNQTGVEPERNGRKLPDEVLGLFDRERIYNETCNFKRERGYWNLIFTRDDLDDVIRSDSYKILALPDVWEINGMEDVIRLEEIALTVIKKYIETFYKNHARRYETENLQVTPLGRQLSPPFGVWERPGKTGKYTVQVKKEDRSLIEEIRKLANDMNQLLQDDERVLPRIHFDNSLYVPILLQSSRIDKISPPGLVESEKKFIKGLRDYLRRNSERFSRHEIFLLRNQPRSGVGFFTLNRFYPDFIMWVKDNEKEVVVFIDPHGLEHTRGLDDEKIQLGKRLEEIERRQGQAGVKLKSFILSTTSYHDLIKGNTKPPSREDYINNNVLFLEDPNWAESLFNSCLNSNPEP